MYLKDPFKKVSYTFRIEEQLLENIKSYANAENRKLPETFNLLLKKSLKDITVSDTYLDNQVGAVIKIPYDLPIAKDNVIDTDGIDTGNVYSIDYNASKASINSMTLTFSLYSHNTIISLCPNWVETESIKDMDQEYLESEMERVNQRMLIKPEKIPEVINELINNDVVNGSIIRIDGDYNE